MRLSDKELRKGNFIQEKDKTIVKVMGLPADGFIQYSIGKINQVYGEPLDHFEPILLTENWLIKFGWGKSDMHEYSNNTVMDDAVLIYNYHFHRLELETDNDFIMIDNIEYVHQLQNLYFALTGKELVS